MNISLTPETQFKLKLLSSAIKEPMSEIIETLVINLWNQKQNEISTLISQHQANKEFKKYIKNFKIR